MQLYAKTAPHTIQKDATRIAADLISAEHAERRRDYFCPECNAVVRLRAGEQRLKHFYHLAKSTHCRQQNKSLEHIQTQRMIQNQIGIMHCALEVAFPSINRIADAVWEEEKLIFEVQCSPMTAQEARARIADYARAHYQVVFILHDKRFNQHRLSALEAALENCPCYFSNVSAEGRGILYDQFQHVAYGCRIKRFAKLPIAIHRPFRIEHFANLEILQPALQERALFTFKVNKAQKREKVLHVSFRNRIHACIEQNKPLLYFQGDLFDLAQHTPLSCYLLEALQVECPVTYASNTHMHKSTRSWMLGWMRHIKTTVHPFLAILWRSLLEKCASK